MTREEVQRAKDRHEAELLRKPNVVGVAVGRKIVGGEDTGEMCLVVLVREKVPAEQLRAHELVPARVSEIPTDVVETGELRALTALLPRIGRDPTARWRPAPGGVSVGNLEVTAGTLGCLVHREGEPRLLSNHHVFVGNGRGRRGEPILQPAPADGGREPQDVLAVLSTHVPLVWASRGLRRVLTEGRNRVDAALGRPLHAEDVVPEVLRIGPVEGPADAALDQPVRKSGRTTGLTEGRVTHLDATVTVAYGQGRRALFDGQIVTSAMSEGGDSGAVAVTEEREAVGLLFAGSSRVTVLNPIRDVLAAFGAEFPPD